MYHMILFVISSMLPTAKPEVITTPLTIDHEFVVLACDGIYVCLCTVCLCTVCMCMCVCLSVCVYMHELSVGACMHTCTLCMQARLSLREGQHC